MQETVFILAAGTTLAGAIAAILSIAAAVWGFASARVGIKRWKSLAARFPLRAQPNSWQSLDWFVADNTCSFQQCGRMAANAEYLWIAPPVVFSWLLPPVQLPWAETTSKVLTKNNELKVTILGLDLRMSGKMIPVELRSRIGVQS